VIYLGIAILVFALSGLLSMAGLGAAFIFVPLFYWLGVPLPGVGRSGQVSCRCGLQAVREGVQRLLHRAVARKVVPAAGILLRCLQLGHPGGGR
jgi:hypothetical protein